MHMDHISIALRARTPRALRACHGAMHVVCPRPWRSTTNPHSPDALHFSCCAPPSFSHLHPSLSHAQAPGSLWSRTRRWSDNVWMRPWHACGRSFRMSKRLAEGKILQDPRGTGHTRGVDTQKDKRDLELTETPMRFVPTNRRFLRRYGLEAWLSWHLHITWGYIEAQ